MEHPPGFTPSTDSAKRVREHKPIPENCTECGALVRIAHHDEIYGRAFGNWPWVYMCTDEKCKARVGMHPNTDLPLGTLANDKTRKARSAAKESFNILWKDGYMDRHRAYEWLAEKMGIPAEECHIGMMTEEQCWEVDQICADYLEELDE